MPLVTVRFDRVFDVVHSMRNRKEVTFFGFESEGTKRYGIPGPGKLSLQAGTVVTAFLRKRGNWQTLAGWFDHSSQEVVVESTNYEVFCVVWCCVVAAGLSLALGAHPGWLALCLSVLSVWACYCLVYIRTLRAIRLELEALRHGIEALPELGSKGGF